jgi:hypothetical protein
MLLIEPPICIKSLTNLMLPWTEGPKFYIRRGQEIFPSATTYLCHLGPSSILWLILSIEPTWCTIFLSMFTSFSKKRNKHTKKNCAQSWFYWQDFTGMRDQQNIKTILRLVALLKPHAWLKDIYHFYCIIAQLSQCDDKATNNYFINCPKLSTLDC